MRKILTPRMIAALLVLFGAMLMTIGEADASPACLTLRQARAAYPDVHLHWQGDHCWYARGLHRKHERSKTADLPHINVPTPRARPIVALDDSSPSPPSAPQASGAISAADHSGDGETVDLQKIQDRIEQPEAWRDRWPDAIEINAKPTRVAHEAAAVDDSKAAFYYVLLFIVCISSMLAYEFGDSARHRVRKWKRQRDGYYT